ncbi:MAG: OmpA family protein [Deltaproteobacteria bacterium]|nr:OmpA family protein [Deltaproteobacteria bacterium]
MRTASLAATALALGVAASATAAGGEQQDFSAQRFRSAGDCEGLLSVHSGEIPGHFQWDVGLALDYAANPLVIRRDGERIGSLLSHRAGGELTLALGLLDYVALEAAIPAVFYQARGEITGISDDALKPLMPAGLSDMRLTAKLRLLREDQHFVSLSILPTLTVPGGQLQSMIAGQPPSYLGEVGVSLVPELALSTRRLFGTIAALNLGYRMRGTTTFQNLRIRDEVLYRFGLGYEVSYLAKAVPLTLLAELSGGVQAAAPLEDYTQSPLEWLAGVQYEPIPGLHIIVGGGSGIVAGYGTPDFRLLAGVRYGSRTVDSDGDGVEDSADACPQVPGPAANRGCPAGDRDRDGVADRLDRCVDQPGAAENGGCPDVDSDGDGVIDRLDHCPENAGTPANQGCPEKDLDRDGLADSADKCPSESEDRDGFEDNDGCPDLDNDRDSVLDLKDKCPDTAGPVENQGCPDTDRDGDGVVDRLDRCPEQNGSKDNDGCPDVDRDGDGVPDRIDNCPDEAGSKSHSGCKAKQLVVLTREKIEIKEKVFFSTGSSKIEKRSFKLLDQIAQVLRSHAEIKKLRIEGHTDSKGNPAANKRLSQARAESVAIFLVEAGIDPTRLEAIGYGDEKPVADNKTAAGREKNRRVEFVIASQE